ncbi:MAG: CapA family protein [Clostridia bacterium]|nr:CapA family protein [Clostridia bacterium]
MRRFMCVLLVCMLLVPTALADKSVKLTFTGDVTLGSEEAKRKQETSFVSVAEREGYAYFFSKVKFLFEQDDLTVVNLEDPLTDSNKSEAKKTYRFRGPTEYVKILQEGSVEAVNFSNNHTYDFGKQGYKRTVETMAANNVGLFGEQTVYIFEKDGIKIAFFGMNSTVYNRNRKWAREEMARLKNKEGVDAIVFVFHGGQEYGKHRTGTQETYGHWAIDYGADLVVMHHPHVVQGIEVYKNRTILYSLGNFCFGGNKDVRALEALVAAVQMNFTDDGEYLGQQVDLWPAIISGANPANNYQPQFATGEQAAEVFRLIQIDTEFELPPFDEAKGYAAMPYLPATDAPAAEEGAVVIDEE